MRVDFACPLCSGLCSSDPDLTGWRVRCVSCTAVVVVPPPVAGPRPDEPRGGPSNDSGIDWRLPLAAAAIALVVMVPLAGVVAYLAAPKAVEKSTAAPTTGENPTPVPPAIPKVVPPTAPSRSSTPTITPKRPTPTPPAPKVENPPPVEEPPADAVTVTPVKPEGGVGGVAPAAVVPEPPPSVERTPEKAPPVRSAARPPKEFIPGYFRRTIHGFNVLVSRMSYDMSDEDGGQPLGYLEHEFSRLSELLPKSTLTALARITIWVEWDHTLPDHDGVLAVYYGGVGESVWMRLGADPRKAKNVCILSLKACYNEWAVGRSRRLVTLHELAHAVHDQSIGRDNPLINNAYRQAMVRDLYRDVDHREGPRRDGYAATSAAEYFAELSCCYLDRVNYTPTDRKGLREYDSVGYELMAKTWGTPQEIEARKKKDSTPVLLKFKP